MSATLTNRLGLSQPFVDAIKSYRAGYSKGDADYSATELLQPAHQRRLRLTHHAEVVEDVSDMAASLLGNALHEALERHGGIRAERRIFAEIDGIRLSGQIDFSPAGGIRDYKVTKVYKIADGMPREWEEQLNIYSFLWLRSTGERITDLACEVLLSDWSKAKAENDDAYPQSPILVIPAVAWSEGEQRRFVLDRIDAHAKLDGPNECSPEERWATPTTYAVMRGDNKRATKVFDTEREAEAFCDEKNEGGRRNDYRIEDRPGEDKRCKSWCNVNFACRYWQDHGGKHV